MANNLKGFRDFLPAEMKIRTAVINTLREVFSSFGFEPLETPALEYGETLLGKYGAEADRLVYTFKDRGDRLVGLRYDLTVPLARVIGQYQNEITFPFKRFQIQPVWRAENTQRGRYREFYQCDIDTVGTASTFADAEIIAVTAAAFKKLGFTKFEIRLNDRQILFDIMQKSGVTDELTLPAIQSLDKLDKKSEDEVRKELAGKGLTEITINNIFAAVEKAESNETLKEIFSYLESFGVPSGNYKFSPTLSRGLDYYTGPIFEVVITEPNLGSLAGGGRYDKLIKQLGGPDVPATGISLGLERIIEVIAELKLPLIDETEKYKTKVLFAVAAVGTNSPASSKIAETQALKLARDLRESEVNVETYPDPAAKLEKQLKYADRKGIPFVAIIGPKEVGDKTVTLKNLKSGEQKIIAQEELINNVR